jgi:hypothetical protein
MRSRTTLAALTFATVGLLVSACGDDEADRTAPVSTAPASTTIDPAVSTTVATLTADLTAPSSTGPYVATGVCPSEATPSPVAEAIIRLDGDWNGDGAPDAAVSWREPNGNSWLWFVRSELAGGNASTYALGELGVGFAALMGNVDVDFSAGAPAGSNREEILSIVGASSFGYELGVFGVADDGCLIRFDDGFGLPFKMIVAGGANQLVGMRCSEAAGSRFLVALQASSADGVTWGTYERRVDRSGPTTLVTGEPVVGMVSQTDAQLAAYGQATCNGQVYLDESGKNGGAAP